MRFVSMKDVFNMALTCRDMRKASYSPTFWKRFNEHVEEPKQVRQAHVFALWWLNKEEASLSVNAVEQLAIVMLPFATVLHRNPTSDLFLCYGKLVPKQTVLNAYNFRDFFNVHFDKADHSIVFDASTLFPKTNIAICIDTVSQLDDVLERRSHLRMRISNSVMRIYFYQSYVIPFSHIRCFLLWHFVTKQQHAAPVSLNDLIDSGLFGVTRHDIEKLK
jgi:hypothetical protein